MAGLDDLKRHDEFRKMWAAIHEIRYATNLNRASLGRGGLRVHSGGVITIENGGLVVTGTAEIIGRLIASGLVNFIGDVVITGPLDVSGPADVSGIMTVLNDLIVASGGRIKAGSIELRPDGSASFATLTISPAGKITSGSAEINPDGSAKFGETTISALGKIKAGGLTIDPTALDGVLSFDNGAKILAAGDKIIVQKGVTSMDADGTRVRIEGTSGKHLTVDGVGAAVVGSLSVSAMNVAPSGAEPNVYWDASDQTFKLIA